MLKSVMIVEDAAFTRMVLRKLVESTGLEVVVEAENGEEAVHKFKVFRPDIVTMDIQLPGMDGIVAVKKIKEMDPHANIIMCSAIGRREDIIRAIHAGAKDYLIKPIQKERFEIALRQIGMW